MEVSLEDALKNVETLVKGEATKILFIVGSNDLQERSVEEVLKKIRKLIKSAESKCKHVTICSMTPRMNSGHGRFNEKMVRINNILKKEFSKYFWKHKQGVNVNKLKPDGVHFGLQGMKNFRRSVIGALMFQKTVVTFK